MALLNSNITGLIPQFQTSPEVVQMDFFSDLSPLNSLIKTGGSSKAKGSSKEKKYEKMLPTQQALSQMADVNLEKAKEASLNLALKELQDLTQKGKSEAEALQIIAPKLQERANELKLLEISNNSKNTLYLKNLERRDKDYENENLRKQYTMFSPTEVVGWDRNDKLTNNPDDIVRFMDNNKYFDKTNTLGESASYVSPILADKNEGDKWLRGVMADTRSTLVSVGGSGEFFGKMDNGKDVITHTKYMNKDNYNALKSAISDIINNGIPVESEIALKQDYINARQKEVKIAQTTNDLDEKGNIQYETDKKGNKSIKQKVVYTPLNTIKFEEGFKDYLTARIASMYNNYLTTLVDRDTNTSLHGEGGSKEKDPNEGYWFGQYTGDKDMFRSAVFGTNGTSKTSDNKTYNEVFGPIIDELNSETSKMNLSKKIDYINKNIQSKLVQHKISSKDSGLLYDMIKKGGLGNIAEVKIPNNYFGEESEQGPPPEPNANQDKFIKYNIPISPEEADKTMGLLVQKSVHEATYDGSASSFGSIPSETVYADGMTIVPEEVRKNLIVYQTNNFFQNVGRIDKIGKSQRGLLAQQTMLVNEDDLDKIKGRWKINGVWQTLPYSDDRVKNLLNMKEVIYSGNDYTAQMSEMRDNNNKSGQSNLKEGKTYYQVDLYQDFEQQAVNLSKTKGGGKLIKRPVVTSGTQYIVNNK